MYLDTKWVLAQKYTYVIITEKSFNSYAIKQFIQP